MRERRGSNASGSNASTAPLDALLRSAVAGGDAPKLAAMAATSERVIYRGAAGVRGGTAGEPVSPDSLFRIASMTKAVTSVAAMQLVEQGALRLDAPVSDYLPEFAELQVLEGFDGSGEPRLRAPSMTVTVKHLLSHTSGFAYEIWNPLLRDAVAAGLMPSCFGPDDGFLQAPLVFDPGSAWEYGINTDWLGRLVETLRGSRLDRVFADEIFGPLGMRDTHFNLPAEKHERLVGVHRREAGGGLPELEWDTPTGISFMRGGDGLLSTASDYTRFLRALLRGGELDGNRILQPDTVTEMGRNQIGELPAHPLRTADPATSNDYDPFAVGGVRFGLGFVIHGASVPGARSAGSLSWAGLYNTYFWLDPARDVCGVFLSQVLPFFDARVVASFDAFERAIYGQLTSDG